jgi:hypothetical protein
VSREDTMLEQLQRDTFAYFREQANPANGVSQHRVAIDDVRRRAAIDRVLQARRSELGGGEVDATTMGE